jgi:large subunit ribosomal protein L9
MKNKKAQVVLTQDIYKLGTVGEVVSVKPGFARNYLIPKGFALRANKNNLEYFETRKVELQEIARKQKEAALSLSERINGKIYTYIAAASEKNMLYGAVTPTVVANLLEVENIVIAKNTVQISKPIKTLGLHDVRIALHNDISATITLNIARTLDESQKNISDDTNNAVTDDLDALNISSTDNTDAE